MKTETFSYLPALSEEQVMQQIQYFLKNGWVVGIEYCAQPSPELAFWNWWKLPLFTVHTAEEISAEINACKAAHPDSYIRLTSYFEKALTGHRQCMADSWNEQSAAIA